jgi:hypothetical protein
MKIMAHAVIRGDIIGSKKLEPKLKRKLYSELDVFLKALGKREKINIKNEVNFGDWFQYYVDQPENALRYALLIKCFLRSFNLEYNSNISSKYTNKPEEPSGNYGKGDLAAKLIIDARVAIGVGGIEFLSKRIGTSDGEAFQLSGTLLDKIKITNATIAIDVGQVKRNEELRVEMELLDNLLKRTTPSQCQVILYKLQKKKEFDIANKLEIKQSAVNQRSTNAGWRAIEATVERFENIAKEMENDPFSYEEKIRILQYLIKQQDKPISLNDLSINLNLKESNKLYNLVQEFFLNGFVAERQKIVRGKEMQFYKSQFINSFSKSIEQPA